MSLTTKCPLCAGSIEFQAGQGGSEIACPFCQKPITLPGMRPPVGPWASLSIGLLGVAALVTAGLSAGAIIIAAGMIHWRLTQILKKP